jgi:hypothetical protein
MSFLLRHKVFAFFLILIGIYWICNPGGKFGIVLDRFVIYSRVPLSFFDIYVDAQRHISIVGNLASGDAEQKWFSDLFSPVLSGAWEKPSVLIVGTGFSEKPVYQMNVDTRHAIEFKGIRVEQVPSRAAILLYNDLRNKQKSVAILLRMKK